MAILGWLYVPLPRYGRKRFFAGIETNFMAFAVLFWAPWWLFWVNWTYSCEDTGERVSSLASKLVLEHLLPFLDTLVAILRRSDVTLPRYWRQYFLGGFETAFTAFAGLSWAVFVTIFHWSDVPLQSYRRKGFFAGFETSFTAFGALFWVLWWLFYVNRAYLCKDTGWNICSQALKSVLWNLQHFIEHFGGYFASIGSTFAKIRVETFFRRLWNQFYSICRYFLSILVAILRQSKVPLPRY